MKIELKSVKYYPSMSEETNCFQASLFVNGVKVADCRNDGRGGCTDIRPFPNFREQLIDLEMMLKSETNQDLEDYVDDLLIDYIRAQNRKKFEAKKIKLMKTSFVIGTANKDEFRVITPSRPLDQISEEGMIKLIAKVKALLKPGETILNTNIKL